MNIVDNISADTITVGDQILIEGDPIEVTHVLETDDIDEVLVLGYSHSTGDREEYSLYADDYYEVWAV